tara:strand:+ start:101 stop:577 length:477 start_codon:yes stop_codon:yes gene_type:complete
MGPDRTGAPSPVRGFVHRDEGYRWNEVAVKEYPATGTVSRNVTKQVLFEADENLPAELRYFEVSPGGYSALERHEHVHAVLILRGTGTALVGDEVRPVQEHDLVYTPPHTWHQFRAAPDAPLGFLCLVNGDRDRPSRPTATDVEDLEKNPVLKGVIRY